MARRRPDLRDLYRLAEQLERDRSVAIRELKLRDHRIGETCGSGDTGARLLCWLDKVAPAREALSESIATTVARLVVVLAGFCTMAGFLLANQRGLVNVFILLLVFVFLQLLFSLLSASVIVRTLSGQLPATLPMHPARWIASRSLPDKRYLREAGSVLRLLLLRYGQEWGVLFTFAALLAFVAIPAVSDFSFVWGSTFGLSNDVVAATTDLLATPWATWLPAATVDPEVLANSRFHPALLDLDRASIERMRGWWSFLFMCLVSYALLPRTLLWAISRYCYRRQIRTTFATFPGSELVLARMDSPLISTQGRDREVDQPVTAEPRQAVPATATGNDKRLLLDWSNALGDDTPQQFEELLSVPTANTLVVGVGSLQGDQTRLASLDRARYGQLAVAVKSWEPPMAELSDLLSPLQDMGTCILYLRPLPGKTIPHRKIEDWRAFARGLPFERVDVQQLNRIADL